MNNGYFTWIIDTLHEYQYKYFLSHLSHFFLEWKLLQTGLYRKHILFSVTFYRRSCRLWDNGGKLCRAGRPQMKIWRMRVAWWIPMATRAHKSCVIIIALPLQQCLNEHTSMSTESCKYHLDRCHAADAWLYVT